MFLIPILAFTCVPLLGSVTTRVIAVIDGDTVMVDRDGKSQTIRLIGIDAPELLDPSGRPQPDGRHSAEFLRRLVDGRAVSLDFDVSMPATDAHGRTLAYVYRLPDGAHLNAQMIAGGYAAVFRSQSFRHRDQFLSWEAAAKAGRRGLWNSYAEARSWESRFSGVKYLGVAPESRPAGKTRAGEQAAGRRRAKPGGGAGAKKAPRSRRN